MPNSAERRRYTRYPIELAGRLAVRGAGRQPCVVRDYCGGGLLLQQPAAARPVPGLAVGDPLELTVDLFTGRGIEPTALSGRVAWVNGEYLGLAFQQPSDALVAVLRRHDRLARGDQQRTATQSGGEVRCLAKLRHVAQGALPGILRELLAQTAERLIEAADAAASNRELQQLYSDMHALDAVRDGDLLQQRVLDRALGATAEADEASTPTGELTLVEPDDFERWLEASRAATVLQGLFKAEITALGSRLAQLRGTPAATDVMLPFVPQHFTRALQDVADELDLGRSSRGVLFEQAIKVLGARLGDLYADFEAALDGLGAPAARAAFVPGRPAAGEAVAAGAPVARPDPADAAAGSRVPVSEVAPVAQVPAPPAAAGISPLAIDAAELAELLQQEAVQRQSLVEELFGHLAEMPNMTDSLAQWLQELDAPLVQEATENRGFFLEEQHPLRVIVDQLAHLQSFRPTPDADPSTDTLRQRVTQLLEPVRRGEADDAVLQAIADQVGALTLEQSRLYQRRVERVSEASAGRDRVRRARLAVAEELDRRYAGKQVPEVVAELIDVGWRAALELAWLNGAEQEQRYARHLAVLDAAVTALGGEAHDPAAPVIAPQALFDAIASELGSTAFDPFRRTALENRLRAELFDPEARPNLVEMPAQARAAGADRPEPPEGVNRHTWQRLLDRCMAVAVGDRVRLLDAPEGRQALRVAWIRDDHTQFVLVDHQGLMARDIELPELALGLHRRRILLEQVDGRPASDRAVEAMLHRMEGRLVYQEAHDSLTGLINRRQFTTALEQALGVADGGAGVLVWIDVDQFRLVNDIHGYDTGDRLLIALARQLDKARGAKVAGHLGGDRFGVLLPELTGVDGERWVEELRRAVAAMPFDWKGPPMALSLSVGIVDLSGDRGGVGSVLRAAESAITAAKATGGGQVYVYREDDPEIAREQSAVQWVVQVDEALDRGRLQLRCQPIVPIRPDRALQPHYEVLLGVANGAGELLPIAQFIEAAERYNRMRAVDRWIARTVIEQIASGRELLPMLHGFAINLSGQTANDPGFVAFIRELFERHAIDPSWVSFEITETAAIADLSNAAGIVRDLKALGCKVALDDFGSGSAPYSYLKELPVDWLKIDGVFVRKVAESMEDLAVVRSINEIGHFLGKQTIAEYVADNTILRRVREIGVDFGQGYAIAPPLQLDELFQQASTGAA